MSEGVVVGGWPPAIIALRAESPLTTPSSGAFKLPLELS